MIPIHLALEPGANSGFDFDSFVRQPGLDWLASRPWYRSGVLPRNTKFKALWTKCIPALHATYGGVCGYLSVYLEIETGSVTVDHFQPKARFPAMAYEWNNFRLCSLGANRRKGNHTDVLDPVGLAADTFLLDLASGAIRPNPTLTAPDTAAATATIGRLLLDSPACRKMRSGRFSEYLSHRDVDFLRRNSPFVWYEANRQGLL